MAIRLFSLVVGLVATYLMLMLLASPSPAAPPAPTRTVEQRAVVDLNQANVTTLMTLPGIGRTRALAIVRYRNHRPFRRPSDLMRIQGIGRKTYYRLKPYLRVGPPPKPVQPPATP